MNKSELHNQISLNLEELRCMIDHVQACYLLAERPSLALESPLEHEHTREFCDNEMALFRPVLYQIAKQTGEEVLNEMETLMGYIRELLKHPLA